MKYPAIKNTITATATATAITIAILSPTAEESLASSILCKSPPPHISLPNSERELLSSYLRSSQARPSDSRELFFQRNRTSTTELNITGADVTEVFIETSANTADVLFEREKQRYYRDQHIRSNTSTPSVEPQCRSRELACGANDSACLQRLRRLPLCQN